MTRFLIVLMAFSILSLTAKSQTQADTSDAYWEVVFPVPASQDIDMKQCLVGSSKDSLVSGFVRNAGSWKFRVDSIYFRGADAIVFSLVSGFPKYEVAVGANKATEFSFIPSRVGLHTAEIVIITQADTLYQTIRGEGVQPQLEVFSGILDFGEVEIGNDRIIRDTVLLKNISSSPITITNTIKMSPDIEQFEIISGGGSFTLPAFSERKLTLQFKPKYGGRTSGRIGFEYNGVGSPAVAQLFGTGIGGLVLTNNDSAYAGEQWNLQLKLANIKPDGLKFIATQFSANICFQRTITSPVDLGRIKQQTLDTSIITVLGEIPNSNLFANIPMIASLGSVEETDLSISNFKLYDAFGNVVDYDVEYQFGTFKILGLCREGGTRLINPFSNAGITNISPNPTESILNIELSLTESGYTNLCLYNNLGEKVMTIYEHSENQAVGFNIQKVISTDISVLGSGQYLLILRTPTYSESKQIIIFR